MSVMKRERGREGERGRTKKKRFRNCFWQLKTERSEKAAEKEREWDERD